MYNQNNYQSNRERKMYQGDWECSKCGAEIKELPFEPDGKRALYCRDCHTKKKPQFRNRF